MGSESGKVPEMSFYDVIRGMYDDRSIEDTTAMLLEHPGVMCAMRTIVNHGIDEANVQEVRSLMAERISIEEGLTPAQCDAALNTIEQALRESRI